MEVNAIIGLAQEVRFEPFQPATNSRFRRLRPRPAIGTIEQQATEETSTQVVEILPGSYTMPWWPPVLYSVLPLGGFDIIDSPRFSKVSAHDHREMK